MISCPILFGCEEKILYNVRIVQCGPDNEALSSGEPKPIISNVARGLKARGQHWKLLAEGHHLIYSL